MVMKRLLPLSSRLSHLVSSKVAKEASFCVCLPPYAWKVARMCWDNPTLPFTDFKIFIPFLLLVFEPAVIEPEHKQILPIDRPAVWFYIG